MDELRNMLNTSPSSNGTEKVTEEQIRENFNKLKDEMVDISHLNTIQLEHIMLAFAGSKEPNLKRQLDGQLAMNLLRNPNESVFVLTMQVALEQAAVLANAEKILKKEINNPSKEELKSLIIEFSIRMDSKIKAIQEGMKEIQ